MKLGLVSRSCVALMVLVVGMHTSQASTAADEPKARLEIPELRVNVEVRATACATFRCQQDVLSKGAMFWPSPQLGRPGGSRPVAIAGHDVTPVPGFGAHGPFNKLHLLHRGSHLKVVYRGVMYRYRVVSIEQHAEDEDEVVPSARGVLVLSTCWPPYSSAYRWDVIAEEVG